MTSNIKIKKNNNEVSSIIIDEPKTYNSLSFKNLSDLLKALKKLDADKKTKVIIIEGAGKGFSAGHNLKEVRSLKNKDKYQKLFNLCSKAMLQIVEGKKPVIAKVHGAAFAAGCQWVASCDLAYSAKDSLSATPGVNIGLFCHTPQVAVSRTIGRKPMMEMLLSGEPISSERAVQIGLINAAVDSADLEKIVEKSCNDICNKSAAVIAMGKKSFYRQSEMPLTDAYDFTSAEMVRNLTLNDGNEGISSFLEKRDPNWSND